jgi:hypothetical protein
VLRTSECSQQILAHECIMRITPLPGQSQRDKAIAEEKKLENLFALNPHPRSVPCISQTPPFLNYPRGQIEKPVARIEEI